MVTWPPFSYQFLGSSKKFREHLIQQYLEWIKFWQKLPSPKNVKSAQRHFLRLLEGLAPIGGIGRSGGKRVECDSLSRYKSAQAWDWWRSQHLKKCPARSSGADFTLLGVEQNLPRTPSLSVRYADSDDVGSDSAIARRIIIHRQPLRRKVCLALWSHARQSSHCSKKEFNDKKRYICRKVSNKQKNGDENDSIH